MTPFADVLFVVMHLALIIARGIKTNQYGPTALLFMLFFDVFFALPVYLDLLFGAPAYSIFSGIQKATQSASTRAAYDLVVWLFAFGFAVCLIKRKRQADIKQMFIRRRAAQTMFAIAYAPFLYVLASGKIMQYADYGAVVTNAQLVEGDFHNTVASLIGVSIVACGVLILGSRRRASAYSQQVLKVAPAILIDIWLMGKRSILAFLLLILGMKVLARDRHQLKIRHVWIGLALTSTLITLSVIYQNSLRPHTQADAESTYEDFRVDMGRDHDLKLALYHEIVLTGEPILEYRMQSMLFIASMFVPRSIWPNKPYPYAVYATSTALGVPVADLGWGLTTSLLSESVSNMGIVGLVLCFVFFVWAVRLIDRTEDPIVFQLGTLSICSLLILQFAAVSVWHLGLLTYVSVGWLRRFFSKRKHRAQV